MDANPNGWVIDGNYERKLETLVIDAADTIVWLDLPLHTLLLRLWRRTATRIRGDVELWNGNRESWRTALWGLDSLFVWAVRSFLSSPPRVATLAGLVSRLRSAAFARGRSALARHATPGNERLMMCCTCWRRV